MSYAVGLGLAALTSLLGRGAGFDRDRAFYPIILIVIASYYVLFAAMGGSTDVLIKETIGLTLFAAVAIAGFRLNEWLVVAGLVAHGVFDFVHHTFISNPGVPPWWPSACLAYDVGLAAMFAFILFSAEKRPNTHS